MKKVNTIIIGCGVAGIGAARTLIENSKDDFLVITKSIGGRILTSDDDQVNYGAYVLNKSYKMVLPLVKRHGLINILNLRFYDKNQKSYRGYGLLLHPTGLIRLHFAVRRFNKHFRKFRQEALLIGQKQAIENDPYIFDLYRTNLEDFADKTGVSHIVNKYFSYGANAFSFTTHKNISAFDFLRIVAPIVLKPFSTFTLKTDEAIRNFKDKIVIDSVVKIEKEKSGYIIKTAKNFYRCNNLIVAVEPSALQALMDIEVKKPIEAYMFHINGDLLKKYKKLASYHVFSSSNKHIVIAKQKNGTYLFYTKEANPDLSEVFSTHEVIRKKQWAPAFNLVVSDKLIEQKIAENFYLAGDFNLTGLEDAYQTGVYAGSKISELA